MTYPGKKLTQYERETFDVVLENKTRRRTIVNGYYNNGNEFVIDFEGTDSVFRIPNLWKSYFVTVKCYIANGTETESAVYDGNMYDSVEYDGTNAQTIWAEETITSTEFVGTFEDYVYIKITLTGEVTNPRFVIKYIL